MLLHNPPPGTALHLLAAGEHPAQQRLAAEELIAHNLSSIAVAAKNSTTEARRFSGKTKLPSPHF